MALQYVGSAVATGNSASFNVSLTALTGGIDTAARAGDLVIVATGFVGTSNGDPGVSTAGYTEEADLWANDTRDSNFSLSWKFMGPTPDTTVACNGSGSASNGAIAVARVYRGVDQASPMDVAVQTATGTNKATPTPPSIAASTSGAIIVIFSGSTGTGVNNSPVAPSGYSSARTATVDPGSSYTVCTAEKAWGGGTETPGAWSGITTSTSDSFAAVTVALRPAATALNADFSSAIQLTGSAAAKVANDGDFTGSIQLSGSATAKATDAADFVGTIQLTGSAAAEVATDARIAGAIELSGSATAKVSNDAQIVGTIDLTGSATATVQNDADFSGSIRLTGSATAEHTVAPASADFVGQLELSGAFAAAVTDGEVDSADEAVSATDDQTAALTADAGTDDVLDATDATAATLVGAEDPTAEILSASDLVSDPPAERKGGGGGSSKRKASKLKSFLSPAREPKPQVRVEPLIPRIAVPHEPVTYDEIIGDRLDARDEFSTPYELPPILRRLLNRAGQRKGPSTAVGRPVVYNEAISDWLTPVDSTGSTFRRGRPEYVYAATAADELNPVDSFDATFVTPPKQLARRRAMRRQVLQSAMFHNVATSVAKFFGNQAAEAWLRSVTGNAAPPTRTTISFFNLVKRVAQMFGNQAAEAWVKALLGYRAQIDDAQLRAAIASRDVNAINAIIQPSELQQQIQKAMTTPFLAAAQAVGTEAAKIMRAKGIEVIFNAMHPDVVLYAREQAASLVVGIPEQTKQIIAEVIARGAERGLTIDQQAKAIKEVIGLPPNWAQAPDNFGVELQSGQINTALSRRIPKSLANQIIKRAQNGTLDDDFIAGAMTQYAKSLIVARATTISRTETIRAAHAGLQQSWKQAQAAGVLPPQTRQFWIITPDEKLCVICERIPAMNPDGRALGEAFMTPEGLVDAPPGPHPNCRCSIGLGFSDPSGE